MLKLSVADEGVGLSQKTTADGLGSRLVRTMALQLNGHFEEPLSARGYHTTVIFPKKP